MDREEVAKKREVIKESMRKSRTGSMFDTHEIVQASVSIPTQFMNLHIVTGTKGIINSVYKWVDGYDVEFKVYGIPVIVSCLENQLNKINSKN